MGKDDSTGFWRKLTLALSLALVLSLVGVARLWYQLEAMRTHTYAVPAMPEDIIESRAKLDSSAVSAEDRQLLSSYAKLRAEINRRLGMGQDALSFVTPDSPAIAGLVKEITGGYKENSTEFWRDCDNIFRWITQNITYSPDTYTPLMPESPTASLSWVEEFWRTPEETLRDKTGDCEDLTMLLASMLLNYNEGRYSVWVIVMGNDSESHIGVAVPVAGKMLTIMDPTVFYITGPNCYILSSRDIDIAVNDWLSHWAEKIPGVRIKSVFNDKFRRDFLSTQGFINWATKEMN